MAKAEDNEKPVRYYIEPITNIKRKILSTYYDSKNNVVIDVYEMKRVIKDAEKKSVEVTYKRKAASQDKELQAKYRRDTKAPEQEVVIIG